MKRRARLGEVLILWQAVGRAEVQWGCRIHKQRQRVDGDRAESLPLFVDTPCVQRGLDYPASLGASHQACQTSANI